MWQKLDDSNTPALFAARTSLDMLDLDAKALALKVRKKTVLENVDCGTGCAG